MRTNNELPAFAARLGKRISPAGECGETGELSLSDAAFNLLALELFEFQFEHNRPYRQFCEARGVHPGLVEHWTSIPAVPTEGFKELELTSIPEAERTTVFHSSGTTGQTPSRHFHAQASLQLYESSLWSWFAPHLLAAGSIRPGWLLVLTPRGEEAPHSSLVHMFECIAFHLELDTVLFAGRVITGGGWEIEGVEAGRFLESAVSSGRPGLVLTTAFGLVQLSDLLAAEKRHFVLPTGSSMMETGGYKGRSRALPKAELHREITRRLGIHPASIVTEYGMSELSSQAYDHVAGNAVREGERVFHFPPWARARLVSPETGAEVADGETGLIRVFDLANVFSVSAIQTGDLGIRRGDGFELIGRAERLEPRGCSLMAIT